MKKKLLVGVISALAGGAASVAPASAAPFPQFWTNATKTTLLRSVTTVPKNQPDAMEFANNGPVLFVTPAGGPIVCNEVEFGATVVVNSGELETKLALPFGIAEGDDCIQEAARAFDVPTYFDTGATGVVPANITFTGAAPPFTSIIHKLKLSQNRAGAFCTVNLEKVVGKVENVVEGFVEESPPNLSMNIEGFPITTTCGKTKLKEMLFAHFFLETMSTTTDTAFLG